MSENLFITEDDIGKKIKTRNGATGEVIQVQVASYPNKIVNVFFTLSGSDKIYVNTYKISGNQLLSEEESPLDIIEFIDDPTHDTSATVESECTCSMAQLLSSGHSQSCYSYKPNPVHEASKGLWAIRQPVVIDYRTPGDKGE